MPELPPGADLESRAVLKACIGARAAVAELKQAGRLLPNQDVLINTIPLLEARASSEIENIVTTTDELFKFAQADREARDPATKEALRYRTALRRGVESLKKRPLVLNTRLIARIATTSSLKNRYRPHAPARTTLVMTRIVPFRQRSSITPTKTPMKIEGRINARTSTLLAALEPVSFSTSTRSVNRMAFWAVWARP